MCGIFHWNALKLWMKFWSFVVLFCINICGINILINIRDYYFKIYFKINFAHLDLSQNAMSRIFRRHRRNTYKNGVDFLQHTMGSGITCLKFTLITDTRTEYSGTDCSLGSKQPFHRPPHADVNIIIIGKFIDDEMSEINVRCSNNYRIKNIDSLFLIFITCSPSKYRICKPWYA